MPTQIQKINSGWQILCDDPPFESSKGFVNPDLYLHSFGHTFESLAEAEKVKAAYDVLVCPQCGHKFTRPGHGSEQASCPCGAPIEWCADGGRWILRAK